MYVYFYMSMYVSICFDVFRYVCVVSQRNLNVQSNETFTIAGENAMSPSLESSLDLLDAFFREADAAGTRTEASKKTLMKGMKSLWKEVIPPAILPCMFCIPSIVRLHPAQPFALTRYDAYPVQNASPLLVSAQSMDADAWAEAQAAIITTGKDPFEPRDTKSARPSNRRRGGREGPATSPYPGAQQLPPWHQHQGFGPHHGFAPAAQGTFNAHQQQLWASVPQQQQQPQQQPQQPQQQHQQQWQRPARPPCSFCNAHGHGESTCWSKHPNKHPSKAS